MQDNPFESPQTESTARLRVGRYTAALATSVMLCAGIWLYRYLAILAMQRWEKIGGQLNAVELILVRFNIEYVIPYAHVFTAAAIVLPFMVAWLRGRRSVA